MRGEKGSLEVFAMWDRGSAKSLADDYHGLWRCKCIQKAFCALCRVSRRRYTSTHLFEGVNHMGRIVITKKTQGCN
jgi:hypothetical protein